MKQANKLNWTSCFDDVDLWFADFEMLRFKLCLENAASSAPQTKLQLCWHNLIRLEHKIKFVYWLGISIELVWFFK